MLLAPDTRERAARAAQLWEACSDSAKVTAASAAIVKAIPLVPVFALVAVVSEIVAKAKSKLANDPPRPDFEEPVRPTFRPFRDSFGTDPASRRVVPFAFAAFQASALIDAMVLAHERAEGAAAQRRHDALLARLREGEQFAFRAWLALLGIAESAPLLAATLPSIPEILPHVSPTTVPEPEDWLARALGEHGQRVLRDAGVTQAELEVVRLPYEPSRPPAELLLDVGAVAGDIGRRLREWKSEEVEGALHDRYN